MKIFISMGMKSKSTAQVKQEMKKIHEEIQETVGDHAVIELINSVIEGADKEIALKGDSMSAWYLGESIKLMAEADLVFFAKGYEDFRGCRIERQVAEAYGKYCVNL